MFRNIGEPCRCDFSLISSIICFILNFSSCDDCRPFFCATDDVFYCTTSWTVTVNLTLWSLHGTSPSCRLEFYLYYGLNPFKFWTLGNTQSIVMFKRLKSNDISTRFNCQTEKAESYWTLEIESCNQLQVLGY